MYAADINTVAVNLAGLPAISLPAGASRGLPVGLQLVARAYAEETLFAAGASLQAGSDWHLAQAPGYAS
jgi:aspartyl-tRNA(Asn)/glutamyl-tRNA(Gln) amidotransferase subunit A